VRLQNESQHTRLARESVVSSPSADRPVHSPSTSYPTTPFSNASGVTNVGPWWPITRHTYLNTHTSIATSTSPRAATSAVGANDQQRATSAAGTNDQQRATSAVGMNALTTPSPLRHPHYILACPLRLTQQTESTHCTHHGRPNPTHTFVCLYVCMLAAALPLPRSTHVYIVVSISLCCPL